MNVPSRRKLWIVTAFLAVVVVSVVGWLVWSEREVAGTQQNDAENAVESPAEVAPLRVEASPARMGDLVLRLSATGLTRARQEMTVSSKVGGQVVRLPVEEGTFVRKEALLMKLDDREDRLAFAEAIDRLMGRPGGVPEDVGCKNRTLKPNPASSDGNVYGVRQYSRKEEEAEMLPPPICV